jgi:diguanylate cyclase (GGDEF)-like protein
MRQRLGGISLLTKFAIVGFICLAAAGTALVHVERGRLEHRAIERAQQSALLALDTAVRPHLRTSGHGAKPTFDGTLPDGLRHKRLRRVALLDDHGALRTAVPHRGAAPDRASVAAALAKASPVAHVAPNGILEVYVPLGAPGRAKPIGLIELAVPYARGITADLRAAELTLAAGLLATYLLLLLLVATGSRALRRQAADDKRRALHDPLTGLANRRRFHNELRGAVERSSTSEARFAVLVIDLDRFKELNDTLGHHVGDQLLRQIGPRLRPVLRADDVLARLGGDEFAVLLRSAGSQDAAGEVAERLRAALVRPFALERFSVHVAASIGVSIFPDDARDGDALMRRADVAMYQAKKARTGWETYSAERDRNSRERLELVGELNRAIGRNELVLMYQPKISTRTGAVTGAEALVRWRHPDKGLLGPDQFLPLAEQAGLMRPLTLLVLDEAIAQCGRWRAEGLTLPVSVNLSATNLIDLDLPRELARLFEQRKVPSELLVLELTESVLMSDPEKAHELLSEVAEVGVKISLDDFGTGYSSLAYLSRLPVDELKIDRSFVIAMEESEQDATIIRSVVDLARNLNLSTVAEGVESLSHLERLTALGCDAVQGYYFSRALPPEELVEWLQESGRTAPTLRAAA